MRKVLDIDDLHKQEEPRYRSLEMKQYDSSAPRIMHSTIISSPTVANTKLNGKELLEDSFNVFAEPEDAFVMANNVIDKVLDTNASTGDAAEINVPLILGS